MRLGATFKLMLGKIEGDDHRHRRLLAIFQGVVTGLAHRVLGVAISLASVPLAINYLEPERYGVWVLLASVLAWARLSDLGIGNGLTNAIAKAHGQDAPERIREHISTALVMLAGIAAILGLVAALILPWVNWSWLFGLKTQDAQSEVGLAVFAAILIFLLGFPLSIIPRALNALQEGRLANYWGAAANLAGLMGLFLVTQTSGGLVWLVMGVSGTSLIINVISGFWLFLRHRSDLRPSYRLVRKKSARAVMSVGWQFFVIQLLVLFVFETDSLVIAHHLGAAHVPSYSLTYTLFNFTSLLQTLTFGYLWVGYSEAIARNDLDWVRRAFRLNMLFSLAVTVLAVIPLIYFAQPFIGFWATPTVVPPTELIGWMTAWTIIGAYTSPIACLLAATGRMHAQIIYSSIATVFKILLSIKLITELGISGVIAATVISYLIFICIPMAFDARHLFANLAKEARS